MKRTQRRLRTATGLVVAPLTFLSMALLAGMPAQAAVGGPRSSAAGTNVVTAASKHAPTSQSRAAGKQADKQRKAAERHYTPASCNRAYASANRASCFAVAWTAHPGKVVSHDEPPATAITPAELQDAYNLPGGGSTETVAIVDAFGYSAAEADLAVFRSQYGLPPCTTANGCFTKVDQNGGTDYPPDDGGWSIEAALDLDAVSAACPGCKLLLVEGDDNNFDSLGISVNTAVSLGAKYVSNSYGGSEDPSETTLDAYYDHPGVAVVASTGDNGYGTSYPAASPTVTAASGTTLTADGSVPRGWTESAWDGDGSGCSIVEPKPDYQQNVDTNCDNRAIGDLSADADPATGLAVYNTIGQDGWAQYGGTSLSSPLLAAMYALAGTPVAGTYPVSYPYDDPSHLNDVTEGSNGGCGNLLCEAGPGWDGPTGLGTPNGVSSLSTGPHGDLTGTVTDADSGDPLAGATVSTPGGYSGTTDASGDYDISLPVGTYNATASDFGYAPETKSGLVVTADNSTTADFALDAVPTHTVSGIVHDGSGHGWPLYSTITIDGYPNGVLYTNPYTGKYSVTLPEGTFTMHVKGVYPGYVTKSVTIDVGQADVERNIADPVKRSDCMAPGYHYKYAGIGETFTGWTGTTPQDGWTVTDPSGNGETWAFDNAGNRTPPPGSDGDLASIDSDFNGPGETQDSSLVSPSADLTGLTSPSIGFDTDYHGYFQDQVGDVDLSVNGGNTWTTVWHKTTQDVSGHVQIPIPAAAGKANVKVRFHFTSSYGWWWQVDNVFLGKRSCVPTAGGLVAGVVRDANTHAPLNGATVASNADPSVFGVSAATPDDGNVPDGFYWLFSPHPGRSAYTVTDGKYKPATGPVTVRRGDVTARSWSLQAGHLTVTPGSITTHQQLGQQRTAQVTFGNDGTQPVHVDLGEQSGAFTPMAGVNATKGGAPVIRIKGHFTPGSFAAAKKPGHLVKNGPQLRGGKPFDAPWTDLADLPTPISSNAVAAGDGHVYSVTGFDGNGDTASGYVYDASAGSWSPIADAPETLEEGVGAYLNGKMYVVGGWDQTGTPTSDVSVYDPASDSWSSAAPLPESVSAASSAVLNGVLYIVGGCNGNCDSSSKLAFSYDPAADSWTQLADEPAELAYQACAGIAGEIVCGGGIDAGSGASSSATYIYDPGSSTWTQGADMPIDLWGGAYAGANDNLQVAGGISSNAITNQSFEYDPSSDSWAALPNANNASFRGAGACGLYKIGGTTESAQSTPFAEVLPGYDNCGATDVPWLAEDPTQFDVAPGQTVTVTVTTDASVVPQPGDYSGKLALTTDSPYNYAAVGVTMHVTPPATWGKIRGTVTDSESGDPVAGATVQICTQFDRPSGTCGPVTYTLKTDPDGYYQLWLNKGFNPLEVIAAKDGYQPQVKITTISAGGTTTTNFALQKS